MQKVLNLIILIASFFLTISSNAQIVRDVSAQEFKRLIDTEQGIILDVRTPKEFALGQIENASSLNFYDTDFESKLKLIQKSETLYVYCRSGGRSAKAAEILINLGQFEVYNLVGGMGAWQRANYPVIVTADSKDENIKSLSVYDFDSLLKSYNTVLVDFHTQWCVPCKKMIPIVDELEKELKGEVLVIRIDLDGSKELAKKYEIIAVPTFVVFENSLEVWRNEGLITKIEILSKVQ